MSRPLLWIGMTHPLRADIAWNATLFVGVDPHRIRRSARPLTRPKLNDMSVRDPSNWCRPWVPIRCSSAAQIDQ
jgi:hypothetical protein